MEGIVRKEGLEEWEIERVRDAEDRIGWEGVDAREGRSHEWMRGGDRR